MKSPDSPPNAQVKPYDYFDSLPQEVYLPTLAEAFLLDRKAQNLSKYTLRFYRVNLRGFIDWCETQSLRSINQLTPNAMRAFLLYLEERGHNPGGVTVYYRSVRAFLRWYEAEFEPSDWRNPLRKVKCPRVDVEPLDPVPLETVRALMDTCKDDKFTDVRDRAILLFLLDTGIRAGELSNLNRQDADMLTGNALIRKSKSRKPRTVFMGQKTRRAMRGYLKLRDDRSPALFVGDGGERLLPAGLREIMRRRSRRAGVPPPPIHSFRRAFALAMKRAGVDVLTISRLLGHSDLSLLDRYIKQDTTDLRDEHSHGSPVDGMM